VGVPPWGKKDESKGQKNNLLGIMRILPLSTKNEIKLWLNFDNK